ncbi:HigA family addiction module antitoxin [Stenotrophomonas sp.]|uniref:HigA family addiction module antitoxin n=1 Tax=Stenotrophomonas sp. TaxID=69392 RepID=UPI0028A8F704|nr:HigA family addiction module antitoxin [Stenotrophomonas sp.]
MRRATANSVATMHPPVLPGEVLAEEFLAPLGMSAKALAKAVEMSPVSVSHIIAGSRAITADTALRLGRYFGTTAQVWLNLQTNYDLAIASVALAETIEHIRPRAA